MSSDSLDKKAFNKTVANNSLVSMASTIIYLVTSVVRAPFCVHYLGMEVWGIWSFSFVITGYLGMTAFGIANVYIRYSAVYYAKKDIHSISKLVSTGLSLTGPGSVIALIALWFLLPSIISYFGQRERIYSSFPAQDLRLILLREKKENKAS